MPRIAPIHAITFNPANGSDISALIAPPYDVLDEASKADLLSRSPHNIVSIDLPHLPAKTVGPESVYQQAGQRYRDWLGQSVFVQSKKPAIFAYQQTYQALGQTFERRGLIANLPVQPFGPGSQGQGGIFPHEQTFSGPKEDRFKLMKAAQTQFSPIFGLHSDPQNLVHALLTQVIEHGSIALTGTTRNDHVRHDLWEITDPKTIQNFAQALAGKDTFIADGHHRYTTALNYKQHLIDTQGALPPDHPANFCMFVLIAMQDPGMIVLPTHRVLGQMPSFNFKTLLEASGGQLNITPFAGRGSVDDLQRLEAALPTHGPHAMGLFCPNEEASPLSIVTTTQNDPLAATHAKQSKPWRQLDVAVLQHLIVEQICQPKLAQDGQPIAWKFPHTLAELHHDTHTSGYQAGFIIQPTPLESVRLVSQANELMPQKSTFFYPKLATGLVLNPLK